MIYERIRYPDSQISAKITDFSNNIIKERINNYEDLFFIRSLGDICNYTGHKAKLFISCLLGQRSDRRFDRFQSFDLKLITDVINECKFDEVTIFDPHSDVTMALINNSVKKSSFEYVEKSIRHIYDITHTAEDEIMSTVSADILLVSPDAGAYKKVFEFGEKLNLPVMGAMKHRDKNGKIDLMFTHDVEGKDCLIVDDLCDGGYTFELLGKALKEHKARKVYLYVSHGLFSKGFGELAKVIDHIYCTNSVKDIGDKFVIGNGVELKVIKDYITQYKVI